MADGGYSKVWRKSFDHEFWVEKRVFSRWEAWLDCWANMAAFKPYKKLVGNSTVLIERGQFLASERFLMTRWRWSKTKVHAFLELLVRENMLFRVSTVQRGRAADQTASGSVYLVVNYEYYQTSESERRPARDQPETSQRPKRSKSKKISPNGDIPWTQRAGDLWAEHMEGTANFGAIGSHLKPLVGQYSESEVLDAWSKYLRSPKIGAQYKSAAHFAQRFGKWREANSSPADSAKTDDVLALIRTSPTLVWSHAGRETAFATMAEKNPAAWARAGPVMPRLPWAELSAVKNNDWELRNAIQHQLSHLEGTATHRNGDTANTAGAVGPGTGGDR